VPLLTPAEADAAIAAALVPVSQEMAPLPACAGRILRTALRAERDAPPFDRVAMDGIAFQFENGSRRRFRVAGIQAAGSPALSLASAGDCFEAMTGAVLPRGCDTVVPVEELRMAEGHASLREGFVPSPWRHVHRRGSDARAGEVLLAAGVRLSAPELAVAASTGLAELPDSRVPRIAVISTGDELVEPGAPILDHQVRRSNAYGLAAALTLAGFPPVSDLQLPDLEDVIRTALAAALEQHDVLVLSGGVSAGRYDHVPAVLASLDVRPQFHGIAQRPGRPMWFGTGVSGQAVFALPGNPVSVLVCLSRYVIPALGRLVGKTARPARQAVLAQEYRFDKALTCFLPVSLGYDQQGRMIAAPRPTHGSGDFIALAGTDGFVELPPGPATHAAGLVVPFHHW
jgi:molybdopterin molybdotransferase